WDALGRAAALNCLPALSVTAIMRPLYHPSDEEITVQGILHALADPVRRAPGRGAAQPRAPAPGNARRGAPPGGYSGSLQAGNGSKASCAVGRAALGGAAHGRGLEGGPGGAPAVRGHLRQHGLHAHQGPDCQRQGRAHATPRRRLRPGRRARGPGRPGAGEGAQRRHRGRFAHRPRNHPAPDGGLHALSGHGPVCVAHGHAGGRRGARSPAHFSERGGAARPPGAARHRAGALPHQQQPAGAGRAARAPAHCGGGGRGAGVCAAVSAAGRAGNARDARRPPAAPRRCRRGRRRDRYPYPGRHHAVSGSHRPAPGAGKRPAGPAPRQRPAARLGHLPRPALCQSRPHRSRGAPSGYACAGGQAPDEQGEPGRGKGRNPRLYESAGARRNGPDSGGQHRGRGRRRGHSQHPHGDVRPANGRLYAPQCLHSSHRVGADSDRVRGAQPAHGGRGATRLGGTQRHWMAPVFYLRPGRGRGGGPGGPGRHLPHPRAAQRPESAPGRPHCLGWRGRRCAGVGRRAGAGAPPGPARHITAAGGYTLAQAPHTASEAAPAGYLPLGPGWGSARHATRAGQ
nr:hypothetical protein [Tanacetum cinerariifolium]